VVFILKNVEESIQDRLESDEQFEPAHASLDELTNQFLAEDESDQPESSETFEVELFKAWTLP
jgi:hypothetical protein